MDYEASQYFYIFFSKETIDWNLNFKDRYKTTRIPARACK